MRRSLYVLAVTAVLALTSTPSRAQLCEASPQTRQSLKRLDFEELPYSQRSPLQLKILRVLLAQYPDDVFLNAEYQDLEGSTSDAKRTVVIEKYKSLADAHPGDSNYAFLYATSLVGANSPDAIARFKALADTPAGYPLADFHLAELYEYGKFANKEEFLSRLDRYFDACPAALNNQALYLLRRNATPDLAAKYGPALRSRLSQDADPDHFKYWESVWTLEFKAHPPAEHAEVRKQVAADLAKFEENPRPADIHWLLVLRAGYKILGDEAARRRFEDRIVAVAPKGPEAWAIIHERWKRDHPDPNSSDSESARLAYYRALLEFSDDCLKTTPNDSFYLRQRIEALTHLDDSTTKQFEDTAKALQVALRDGPDTWSLPPAEFVIADAYLRRRTNLDEIPALVAAGFDDFHSQPRFNLTVDYFPDDFQKYRSDYDAQLKVEAARLLVDAAQQLKNPAIAKSALDNLAGVKPEKPAQQATIWEVKAKWAELNDRKLDAMLMYRAALDLRPTSEKPSGNDELAANIERLRNELGGTAESEKLFASNAAHIEISAEGDWQAQTRDLPPWQLSDLTGKTWTAASLHGKTVLINIWAAWCAPCRSEHPMLQAFYDKIKNRSDIQLVTFNVDDEVGDVAPYMAEHKYTFPVLLATNYMNEAFPEVGFPRLWIVDPAGKWRWEQVGLTTNDAKWEKQLLEKLDNVKPQ